MSVTRPEKGRNGAGKKSPGADKPVIFERGERVARSVWRVEVEWGSKMSRVTDDAINARAPPQLERANAPS